MMCGLPVISLWKGKFSLGFWSVRQLPFMCMNINRNSNKTLRGVRWNGFSHVCVDCSLQTHSYPPQHSNLLWIAPHSQHNEHLRHLIHTPSFSHYTEFKFYREYTLTWLKAQRNGLSLPNSSFLSLSYTNYKTAVPLLSVKEHWKWIRYNQRSKHTGCQGKWHIRAVHRVLFPWAWQPRTKQATRESPLHSL